jgi:hypothetical protein
VLIGMQGLKQHWAQYRNNQRKLTMSLFIFISAKDKKTRKENHLFHKKYFFVKQMVLLKLQKLVYTNLFAINIQQFERICSSPLRKLSATIHIFKVFSWLSSRRILPTKQHLPSA